MSTNWLTAAEPQPRLLVLPPDAVDLGEADAAIELWEHYSGKTLDDTQRLVVQVLMAIDADGKWAASTTGREMPRQNGKGDEIEVVELWGLVQRGEAILHTVHDAVLLASQTQQRMLGVLEGHPDLRRRIKKKWQGTGQQMIELRNGGVIWYRTRTGGGGRGVDDIDRLVVDEAQHATEEQLAAVSPTLLANPNPQLNAMGTAGLDGISRWWWSVRKRALSADPGRFGYVGHTVETVYLDDAGQIVQEPVDASDRSLWPQANPFVASGRGGGMAFLEEQYRTLPEMFAGEHLGVWAPPPLDAVSAVYGVVPKVHWTACATKDPAAGSPGWLGEPVTLAVEADQNLTKACIAVAGSLPDGIGAAIVATGPGTGWVFDTIAAMWETGEVAQVVIDSRSPAAALTDPLEQAGVTVVSPKTNDVTKATSTLRTLFADGGIEVRPSPELDRAAAVATLRKAGESQAIDRWGDQDAVPLIGVNLAVWGHQNPGEPEPYALAVYA